MTIIRLIQPYLPGKRLLVIFWGLPGYIWEGLSEVCDMLPGPGGDLQSLQGSRSVHRVPEYRQDGLLVPLRSGGAQHRDQPRIKWSTYAAQCSKPVQHSQVASVLYKQHHAAHGRFFSFFFFSFGWKCSTSGLRNVTFSQPIRTLRTEANKNGDLVYSPEVAFRNSSRIGHIKDLQVITSQNIKYKMI